MSTVDISGLDEADLNLSLEEQITKILQEPKLETKDHGQGGVAAYETKRAKLMRTPDFKTLIRQYPNSLSRIKDLLAQADGINKTCSNGDLTLTCLDIKDKSTYYKLQIGKEMFFLKYSSGQQVQYPDLYLKPHGFYEMKSALRLKEALRDIPNVRVIEPQIGYSDDKRDVIVTKWEDGMLLKDYLENIATEEQALEIKNKVSGIYHAIRQAFGDKAHFVDMADYNIFYDPKDKTFILFDLFDAREVGL